MRFERINPDRREFRVYELWIQPTLFGEFSLLARWGRKDRPLRQRIVSTGKMQDIKDQLDGAKAKRLKSGYRLVELE